MKKKLMIILSSLAMLVSCSEALDDKGNVVKESSGEVMRQCESELSKASELKKKLKYIQTALDNPDLMTAKSRYFGTESTVKCEGNKQRIYNIMTALKKDNAEKSGPEYTEKEKQAEKEMEEYVKNYRQILLEYDFYNRILLKKEEKEVKFKRKGEISLEGKSNETGFIFDIRTMKLKLGKKLFCNLKPIDERQKNCFKNRIKFCRVLKRYIRGKRRYFLQIVFEGIPETDFQIGEGEVGLDIGTSTVAVSSDDEVKLLKLSETERETRKIRILQRSLDRKRRMANPDNYDENGRIKKKRKEWKLSKNYFKELNKLKEIYRKKRVKDNQHKNILVKFILSQGDTVKTEKTSVSSWKSRSKKTVINKNNGKTASKKRFGKSVINNAPGTLKRKLSEKLSYFGKELIEINPFKTKASQFNHISQEFKKCSLEVRFKELVQGIVVQRDLYSAFLIKNVENLSEYNMKKINEQFNEFYEKQMKEIERIKNEGSLKFYVSGKTV